MQYQGSTAWKRAIATAEANDCFEYSTVLRRALSSADPKDAATLELLANVTSMALTRGAGLAPLKPFFQGPQGRTAVPADLTDSELDQLQLLLSAATDEELRARVSDVLWTRRRVPEFARSAIRAYISAAEANRKNDVAWMVRVERALAFAAAIRDSACTELLKTYLQANAGEQEPSRRNLNAIELCAQYRFEPPSELGPRAERRAQSASESGDVFLERGYYEIAAVNYRRSKDRSAVRRCQLAEAETYAAEAARASDAPTASFMKAHFYQQAIEAFRRVGGCSERVDQLHRELVQIQQRSAAQMKSFEGPSIDLTATAAKALESVDGLSPPQALLKLATMVRMPSLVDARAEAKKLAKGFPLSALFGIHRVTSRGRTVAKAPGMGLGDVADDDEALLASMYAQREQLRQPFVVAIIEPVRAKIWRDHNITEQDLWPLVANNPMVPNGREEIFLRALHSGLSGDYLQASHLAVPQIENALRMLLIRKGAITTGLNDHGIQFENSLGTLLDKPELVRALGEDRIFDIKSLLAEHHGSNLRNLLAHGLLSYDDSFSVPAVYCWWLLLSLCFLPVLVDDEVLGESAESTKIEDEDAPI